MIKKAFTVPFFAVGVTGLCSAFVICIVLPSVVTDQNSDNKDGSEKITYTNALKVFYFN